MHGTLQNRDSCERRKNNKAWTWTRGQVWIVFSLCIGRSKSLSMCSYNPLGNVQNASLLSVTHLRLTIYQCWTSLYSWAICFPKDYNVRKYLMKKNFLSVRADSFYGNVTNFSLKAIMFLWKYVQSSHPHKWQYHRKNKKLFPNWLSLLQFISMNNLSFST